VTTAECTENGDYCERSADCVAREVWMEVEEAIQKILSSITLSDLVKRTQKGGATYQI
jgi:DNA-binding IscR family transcriptional regulator